jgi:uncharacterized protein (TIGR03437 family)
MGAYNGSGSVVESVITFIRNTPNVVATVSAASFQAGPLAAESIAVAFGMGLATGVRIANTFPLPFVLLGTSIQVTDSAGVSRPAPLFFVSAGQINYLIPAGSALGAATVTITSGDGQISAGTIQIVAVSAGVFAANSDGKGIAAAQALRVTATGSQIYEEVAQFDGGSGKFVPRCISLGPAEESVLLIFYGTGLRGVASMSAVTATIGGVNIPVIFAGAQGGYAGLDQINLGPIPRELIGRGTVDIVIRVNGQAANTVLVCIN